MPVVAGGEGEGSTIRRQTKKAKTDAAVAAVPAGPPDKARMNKEVVKGVLASPLIVPWPAIRTHLQKTILETLPKLVPPSIAEYHTDRARCHKGTRSAFRRQMRVQTAANKIPEAKTGDHSVLEHSKAPAEDQAGVAESIDVDVSNQTVKPGESSDVAVQPTKKVHVGKGATTQTLPVETDPVPAPEDLRHLVLGINEVIKALEAAIEYLKILLMMISDALNTGAQQRLPTSGLLPTAPTPGTQPKLVPSLVAASPPLVFIIIPLLSISPQSLVSPIPQYCATYNSHVYQWTQLKKVVETRLKQSQWDILGPPREEVRVVPLGQVEADMAKMVGLRRLACLGIRSSHPDISLLHELLPKSILHPPRHSITLPFPSSTLRVHPKSTRKQDPSKPSERSSSLPLPHVHFAPLTIKGITTSVPVDGMARKQRRLEEVRQRRRETKERKKEERRKEIKLGIAGQERKDRLAKKRKALKLGPSPKKRRKVEHASKPGI